MYIKLVDMPKITDCLEVSVQVYVPRVGGSNIQLTNNHARGQHLAMCNNFPSYVFMNVDHFLATPLPYKIHDISKLVQGYMVTVCYVHGVEIKP